MIRDHGSRTVFIQMGVMGNDLTTSRLPVFCIIRRKLGGFLTSLRERIRNLVKFHDHISPALVEGRRREFRRTSLVVIGHA
jgi:hypothetical protein